MLFSGVANDRTWHGTEVADAAWLLGFIVTTDVLAIRQDHVLLTPSGLRSMRSPVLLERPENSNHRLWAARPTFRRHAYVRHYPPTFAAI
jgi:hypothetical protein